MMHRRLLVWLVVLTFVVPASLAAGATAWLDKVHPRIVEQVAANGEAEFLILLD